MSEKEPSFEKQESIEQTPRPNLLDAVKIDGRWAQVMRDDNYIRFWDDKSDMEIKWDNCTRQTFDKYKKSGHTNIWVSDLVEENKITSEEYNAIHGAPKKKNFQTLETT